MVSILGLAISIAVTIFGTFLIEEVINFVITRAAKRAGANPTLVRDVGAGLRIIAIFVVVSGILTLTGLASEFTALTISGIGALAVSLALQTTLSNVISGILLFYDGAIHLDDTIEYSSVKGRVVRLALRNTWIKTDSGTIAVVSNSSLSSGPLINHSATARISRKYAID